MGPMNAYVALAFSPDSRVLAMGDQVSPVVRLWDMTSGSDRASLPSQGTVVGVAISPDGTMLAAADFQGTITFWDMESLGAAASGSEHPGVRSLALCAARQPLATGGFDGTIKLWNSPQSLNE